MLNAPLIEVSLMYIPTFKEQIVARCLSKDSLYTDLKSSRFFSDKQVLQSLFQSEIIPTSSKFSDIIVKVNAIT